MLTAKKHMRILSREVRFWTRIWFGRGNSFKAEMKSETMVTQITEMEAKVGAKIVSLLIIRKE